jgi:hypothetical protein
MIRLARVVIVAGAAVAFAACSETGPTAPPTGAAAAGNVVIAAAPTPSASCTVTPNGAGYDVTVSWSGFSVTNIDLWQSGGIQPVAQAVLGHPTRKGSLTFTGTTAAPDYAQVIGRDGGLRVLCTTVI